MQLHHAIDRIHAAGAELHVIGNGAPMFIAGFRTDTGYTGPLYTDPSLAVYAAAELERGVGTLLRPSVLGHTVRALKGGFRQKKTMGDPLQQGGVLIVGPDGGLRWRYISKAAGDHPPVETILARLAG